MARTPARFALGADRVTVATWAGGPGESHVFLLQSRETGLRVVAHVWHDEGRAITVRLVRGDGRRADFEVIAEEYLHGSAQAQEITDAVAAMRSEAQTTTGGTRSR